MCYTINPFKMLDRKIVPQIRQVEQLNFPETINRKLDNGIEIAMLQMGSQEVVHVEFVFTIGITSTRSRASRGQVATLYRSGFSARPPF